jgi:Leucine-rich repeat (LRR) protein
MGKTTCPGIDFIHGDINGDGLLNEREILRLIYAYNIGHNWGPKFTDWHDPFDDPCALNGVTCTGDKVAKIDISDAQLCSTRDRKSGPDDACLGIPSEIALLNKLEVLIISRRQHFRGTLPTELGKLSSLTYLDISNSLGMKGPIPSELGLLTNLKYLNLGGCRFNESIPDELYELSNLEILNLSMNFLKGHISPNIRKLRKVKELMMSRTLLSGSLPTDLGNLRSLENLEMYGNRFSGRLGYEVCFFDLYI